MSPLESAKTRLIEAIDRLEAAAQRPPAGRTDADAEAIAALRADRDRLDNSFSELQSRYARLRETSEMVSRRLDGAIGQIRRIVES